jgi:hypothetical protein
MGQWSLVSGHWSVVIGHWSSGKLTTKTVNVSTKPALKLVIDKLLFY